MAESSSRRKIAVIFATDVVGYSTKMEENEDQTLKNLKVCRNIIEGIVDEHHGRIFNTAGDSVLAEFESAVEAVICASEFQNTIKERNNTVSDEEHMEFRVGINMGDVVIEGGNLYGEGVNVAARLEALAQPGGICLSRNVHEIVNKKTNFQFHDLGEQTVKNTVLHAVDVTLDGTSQRKLSKPTTKQQSSTEKPPAIAVLPFTNMSGDSEQEYFADGITEDIITNLSLWKTFPVISRNSSFTYKGKNINVKEAANELGVRYIVEGSVRKGGNKVRITAQLIDAFEDHHLWSKKWDRSLDDIFEVQDEVSSSIAALVSPAVKNKEETRIVKIQTTNMSAWDEYLRGLSCYNNHQPSEEVKKHSFKSIELDENLSDAYILICNSLYQEIYGSYGATRGADRESKEEEFHRYALKSYQLDPENPEALIALSRSYNMNKDFKNRIEFMKKALEINPNHADANYEYGLSLTTNKDFEDAKNYVLKGLELNPYQQRYYPPILCCIGLEEYEEAIEYCNKSLEVDPDFTGAYGWKASMLGNLNKLEQAQEVLKKYLELRPEIKTLKDYEKVAPTVIKEILLEGLKKAGLPE